MALDAFEFQAATPAALAHGEPVNEQAALTARRTALGQASPQQSAEERGRTSGGLFAMLDLKIDVGVDPVQRRVKVGGGGWIDHGSNLLSGCREVVGQQGVASRWP